MGLFSWKTADTNESISNKFSDKGALPVKMIDDKNNVYIETDYEGYGVFGGVDFYLQKTLTFEHRFQKHLNSVYTFI